MKPSKTLSKNVEDRTGDFPYYLANDTANKINGRYRKRKVEGAEDFWQRMRTEGGRLTK